MPEWLWVLIVYLLCPVFREDFLAVYSGMQLRTEFQGNEMVPEETGREGERIYSVMSSLLSIAGHC